MNEVTPWISDYFVKLATTYGSKYHTAPPAEKLRKCQLKKVLTQEPGDHFWVILSDTKHEIPSRIPKEVVEQCLKGAHSDEKLTRHTGSLIDIRNFTPLFVRVEDGPSTSRTREVLALEVKKAKLRGATRESTWGSPQPLDSVSELKEWLRELRNPYGNRDILKIRKKQEDDAKAVKQFTESPELPPGLGLHLQPATRAPAAALQKGASTTSTVGERLPMQRYRRKWLKAVPGLDEFAHRLQIPEDIRLKILEKETNKRAEGKLRSSGTVHRNRPPIVRGALEIGSSPARLSPVPRATTPEEWPSSPHGPKGIYDGNETEMSSDVDSSRPSSPIDAHHDIKMDEVDPQPEIVPETPQVPVDSQTQHLSPPPPAQPPRPRSSLPSSSDPQTQNALTSPASIHTSVQAVSGSQLPSLENPPAWAPLDDEPSGGPSFVLPWSQRDDPLVAVSKLNPAAQPSSEKRATKLPSPVKEPTSPAVPKPAQEKETVVKKIPRVLAFGESVFQAIEQAFQQGSPAEVASTTYDPSTALPASKATIAQLPPPKPRSKPPSKMTQSSVLGPSPSPLDRLAEADHSEPPVRRPFEALNRKVPVPEVGPTREPVRGRDENGVLTMVLIPASDDTKLSSPLKKNSSSQPVQSSQSIPSSQPQIQRAPLQSDKSIVRDGNSVVQANETVADVGKIQDPTGNTQSSLEYASTQDDNKVAADVEAQKLVDGPLDVGAAAAKVADAPLESPLPQIAAIHEVESQQSATVENEEEVDELEDDSDVGSRGPVVKRKPKQVRSKPPSKVAKNPKLGKLAKPTSPSKAPSNPAPRTDSVVEKVPSRSSSRLPSKSVAVIERKRIPVVLPDGRATVAQKRRLSPPSEEEFPAPQPVKRSKIHGHHRPVQTALPPKPRTPSPLPQEGHNSVVSSVSRSVKGKERAAGIKGLEKIGPSEEVEREGSGFKVPVKKKAPDTGSKRKPSDAFSARDDSRDGKRQRVDNEPEPRKLGKQPSFVNPDMLKRPFHKPQIHKVPARHGTTTATTANPSTVAQPDGDERVSKYFNPQIHRGPEYPRAAGTPETEPPQKVVDPKPDSRSKQSAHENGRGSGKLRPRIESRKPSRSNSDHQPPGKSQKPSHIPDHNEPPGRSATPTRVQHPIPVKKVEKDLVATGSQHPPARKLGTFAPDLNPPPLLGLPGGRLMNKQLREILIRTGKVRVKEAKVAGLNLDGRR